MKRGHYTKALCLFAVLVFGLSAFVFSGTAADEALVSTSVTVTDVCAYDNDNITANDGYDHAYAPNISVFQNADNSYAVCIDQTDGTLKIIETDSNMSVKNAFTADKELTEFAAFTKGPDGTYYVLFGNEITDKDPNKTSMRLINYDASGKRLRSLDFPGNASGHFQGIAALECGNHALSVNSNYITGYVGRLMFTADTQGLVHQASYAFAVDIKTFKQITVENSTVVPYASHSFHQMIMQDGTDFLYVDRSDAEPKRSFHLTKMSGNNSWEMLAKGDSYIFKGKYGFNDTFSQLGGIVKTSAGYLLVSSYQNTTESTDISAANLITQLFDTDTLKAQPEKALTNYTGIRADGVTNPKAVLIGKDRIAVPYMVSNQFTESKRMYLGILDAYGNLTDNRAVTTNAIIPRFGQVMYNSSNNSIEWFSISNGTLILYSIDLSDIYKPESETVCPSAPCPEESAPQEVPSTQAPTQLTTTPATQAPDEAPPQPGFFQSVLDFFVGIYNWFVSLFASLFT